MILIPLDNSPNNKESKVTIQQGLLAAWPICLGYIPIGLAFGVLAQKAGLQPIEIAMMSIFVFAGSSQFIAVSMISAGAAPIPIIITTFMVNLRHLLMSSALAVFAANASRKRISVFAYGVTDESFAVNYAKFSKESWDLNKALVVNHAANLTWIICTILGGYGGQFIPSGAFGIDYALISMFICLLIFQMRGRIYLLTGVIAGLIAVILSILIKGNSYIVLASIIGATVGLFIKRWARK